MPLDRISDRCPNYRQTYFEGNDLKGLSVWDINDQKVGYVTDIILDESGEIAYLVVTVGSGLATWFGERRKVVLPASLYDENRARNCIVVRQLSQREIKALPSYEQNQDLDAAYEAELKQVAQKIATDSQRTITRAFAEATLR